MSDAALRPGRPARKTAVALFVFLCAVYLLFYTGNYYSIDEIAMFSMADSLWRGQGLSIDQLAWMQMRPQSSVRIGEYGLDGRLYAKVAPTQALLALPLMLLAHALPALGAVKLVFLSSIWLTAGSAVLLYALGRRLGYGGRSSVLAALLFGLATPALPYARTFFAEPLSGFCILGSFYLIIRYGQVGGLWRVGLSGLLLGVAGATRPLNFLPVPFFGLLLFVLARPGALSGWRQPGRLLREAWRFRRETAVFVLPVLAAIVLLLLYNQRRFASVTEAGYAAGEGFVVNPLSGAYVLFLSPGKSVFLYAPLFLLLPVLWWRLRERRPAVAWAICGASAAYVGMLTLWYGSAGGWAWGPRLLLPLVPLWSVLLLPLPAMLGRSRGWRAVVLLLLLLTAGVQLLGATVDFAEALRRLAERGLLAEQANVFRPELAAHFQHWLMVREGRLDLAWLLRQELEPVSGVDWRALLPLLALCLFGGWTLWQAVARPEQRRTTLLVALAVPALALTSYDLVAYYSATRIYRRPAVQATVDWLQQQSRPGDGLLTAAITHSQPWQNLYAGRMPVYGAVNDPLPAYSAVALERLEQFAGRQQRLWLLTEWLPAADPQSGLELWLAGRAFLAQEWVGDGLRLRLYDLAEEPALVERPARLGDAIELQAYGVAPESIVPGGVMRVLLSWGALAPVAEDYTVFVQLLDEAGQVVAQVDRRPGQGLWPTSQWRPGETVLDRTALLLPEELPAGRYRLSVGMYQWPSLARLPAGSGADTIVLQEVSVGAAP